MPELHSRLDLSDWVIHFIHDRDETNLPSDDEYGEVARLPYTTDIEANQRFDFWEIRDTERPIEPDAGAFGVLLRILEDGGIRTSWSFRARRNGTIRPTIYGPRSASCFTEMPLYALLEYARNRGSDTSVTPYAIAIRRQQFFGAGGRPVIYGLSGEHREVASNQILPRLLSPECGIAQHEQYRYVAMSLQIDWSHEREWRWSDCKDECDFPLLPIWLEHERISFDDVLIFVSDNDEQTMVLDKLKEMRDAASDEYGFEYNLKAIDSTRVINLAVAKPQTGGELVFRVEDIPSDMMTAFRTFPPNQETIDEVAAVWHQAREAAAHAAAVYRANAHRNENGQITGPYGFADLVTTSSQSEVVLALQALGAVTALTGIGYKIQRLTDGCTEHLLDEREAAIHAAEEIFAAAYPDIHFHTRTRWD